MGYAVISGELKSSIASIVGEKYVFDSGDELRNAAADHTEDLVFLPGLVVKPSSAEEISGIIRLCNQHNVPVTPRGGGTGVSGGALPVHGGIVIHTSRLDKIISIDKVNRCATVEAGVITQVFQDAVLQHGLFFPPDPGSKGSCFLGGNLAESSGGPRSLKYGVTKDYVLNLEVVLPNGDIIWTGKNVTKNATGYDLTALICGSEGTLGIITKIVFRLIAKPANEVVMLMPFQRKENVFNAVNAVFEKGYSPAFMEFIDETSIEIANKFRPWTNVFAKDDIAAYLWIGFDGEDAGMVLDKCASLAELLYTIEPVDAAIGQTSGEQDNLWTLRRQVGESIISYTVFKDIDTVVPVSNLASLISGLKSIGERFNFRTACFGHIGNGNLHLQILKEKMSDEDWKVKVKEGVKELFGLVNSLGGSVSGEHGIGYLQKEFMPITVSSQSIQIMKQIKSILDPNHIMNPGKIF